LQQTVDALSNPEHPYRQKLNTLFNHRVEVYQKEDVLCYLNPVLVVDESHNAESDLSVDMLKNLNPSFILDLTATPKDNSNIISLFPTVAKNLHTHVIDRKEIKRGKALYVSNSNEDSNLLF